MIFSLNPSSFQFTPIAYISPAGKSILSTPWVIHLQHDCMTIFSYFVLGEKHLSGNRDKELNKSIYERD